MFTPNGRSVRSRILRISSFTVSSSPDDVSMIPQAPHRLTAEASWDRAIQPIGACTIGNRHAEVAGDPVVEGVGQVGGVDGHGGQSDEPARLDRHRPPMRYTWSMTDTTLPPGRLRNHRTSLDTGDLRCRCARRHEPGTGRRDPRPGARVGHQPHRHRRGIRRVRGSAEPVARRAIATRSSSRPRRASARVTGRGPNSNGPSSGWASTTST